MMIKHLHMVVLWLMLAIFSLEQACATEAELYTVNVTEQSASHGCCGESQEEESDDEPNGCGCCDCAVISGSVSIVYKKLSFPNPIILVLKDENEFMDSFPIIISPEFSIWTPPKIS